jgi:hypothetical protein
MQIIIKRLDGERKPFEVDSKDTLGDLKKAFGEKMGIAVQQLRLIYKGAPLLDDKTIGDYKIVAGEVVHVVLQLNGG